MCWPRRCRHAITTHTALLPNRMPAIASACWHSTSSNKRAPVPPPHPPHLKMSSQMSRRQGRCSAGARMASTASRHVVASRSVTMSSTARGTSWSGRRGTGCNGAGRTQAAPGAGGLGAAPVHPTPRPPNHRQPQPPPCIPLTRPERGALVELAGEASVQLVAHKRGGVSQHRGAWVAQRHRKRVQRCRHACVAWEQEARRGGRAGGAEEGVGGGGRGHAPRLPTDTSAGVQLAPAKQRSESCRLPLLHVVVATLPLPPRSPMRLGTYMYTLPCRPKKPRDQPSPPPPPPAWLRVRAMAGAAGTDALGCDCTDYGRAEATPQTPQPKQRWRVAVEARKFGGLAAPSCWTAAQNGEGCRSRIVSSRGKQKHAQQGAGGVPTAQATRCACCVALLLPRQAAAQSRPSSLSSPNALQLQAL